LRNAPPPSFTVGSIDAELKDLFQRKAVVDELIRKLERYATLQAKPLRKSPPASHRESWATRLAS
ncbi:MAG: hypothetical protein ABI165_13080, partial [Bryobacteraceae bacterium]